MDPSFQSLLERLNHLSDQFRELRDRVRQAVAIADLAPEMALTCARKVLEYVIRDVYQRRCNEPPGTRPLENLIQRLVKDGYFPDRLDAYATTVRKLGNVGTHTFGETITAADVYQSLTQLMPILEWYFETERPDAADNPAPRQPATDLPNQLPPPPASEVRIAVVPKGLRSFDANDADFFLGLLPGARDKHGLPESVRFWKHAIEDKDEPKFSVGVIYGPSGCGKSSLVKAGLLPRLAARVVPVYVEATAADTEARLLKGLRRRFPGPPADADLPAALAALRRGEGLADGQKVLIVVDQFEQWLHARRQDEDTELARALRQCDGERVQAVVLVRDDFWMALTRFLGGLNIELHQGRNAAAVDLFDPIHARAVLAAFGRAFGRLAEEPSKEQAAFLDQAVAGLAQDGRVICVRLALFAEMVKGRPWTPATLKAVGGTEGVGAAFLEETFGAAAGARNRRHQSAARSVLKALLPEQGTDIKGHMRSYEELLEASDYAGRPADFKELLHVLDDVRLITPTQPPESDAATASSSAAVVKYYQLTHDYLVHSLREWLNRKQRETRRGRAELRLAERSAAWNARPETRHLPAWWEWLNARFFTRKHNWTLPQRKMMGKAARHHGVRAAGLAVLLTAAVLTIWAVWGQVVADGLVNALLGADIDRVAEIIKEMGPYRRWADPKLRDGYADARKNKNPGRQLRAGLALLPVDASQVDYLYGRLLDAEPGEVPVIRDALKPHKEELVDGLWKVVEAPEKGKESQRLRAAAALAKYDPAGGRWDKAGTLVVDDLVRENPIYLGQWSEAFRPVKDRLLPRLSEIFRDQRQERAAERGLATNLLADYAADNPPVLADLLMDADEKQFAVIYPTFKEQGEPGLSVLTGEMGKELPSDLPSSDERREKLAKRQANAAVALLRMNQPAKVWPLLMRHDRPGKMDDPRVRSYLVNWLAPRGADAAAVLNRLDEEPDVTIRRALLLSLGEYDEKGLSPEARQTLLPKVRDIYRTDADAGLHAASEWLLRTWKQEAWLKQVNEEWAKDQGRREKRIDGIKELLTTDKEKAPPQWYVNGQGQTMVVIPGPVEFLMGSPTTQVGRQDDEIQHKERIGRTFALAAKSVTVEQYRKFDDGYQLPAAYARTADLPVVGTSWRQAAGYCNWLGKEEGIPADQWCYEIDDGQVTKPKANYLSRTGYRLPTEAEMEVATRAGALTSRYFGETEDLLPKYARYVKNSREQTWPVGSLKPNDLGLFDVQGDVWTWCQERYEAYPAAKSDGVYEDKEDVLSVDSSKGRSLRGGSFLDQASTLRSAFRFNFVPAFRFNTVGFRPARTVTP